jgi:hypothetical protein
MNFKKIVNEAHKICELRELTLEKELSYDFNSSAPVKYRSLYLHALNKGYEIGYADGKEGRPSKTELLKKTKVNENSSKYLTKAAQTK